MTTEFIGELQNEGMNPLHSQIVGSNPNLCRRISDINAIPLS